MIQSVVILFQDSCPLFIKAQLITFTFTVCHLGFLAITLSCNFRDIIPLVL